LKITRIIKSAESEHAISHVFDNGLLRRELFPLRLSQIMPSDAKVSLHCMSCKESHPHLYVLHKEKTSEQMQEQEIDCYGRNQNILLFTEPNSFADKIKKFGNRQISWDEIPTTSQQE
jgi:hypothetical protein